MKCFQSKISLKSLQKYQDVIIVKSKIRIQINLKQELINSNSIPQVCPKGLMIKRRKNKSGIHNLGNSNHITYLDFNK